MDDITSIFWTFESLFMLEIVQVLESQKTSGQ
jgi:hypothetical protein